jgi:Protein of unknown function (DUF3617).
MRYFHLVARFRLFVVLCLTSLLFSAALHAGVSLTPGEYKFTYTTDGQKDSTTMTVCLGPQDAKFPDAAWVEKTAKASGCKVKNYNVTGNKVSYTVVCGEVVATTSATYQQQSFETYATSKGGPTGSSATHISAKRIGPCKGK